jgi:hypothetical protein
LFAHFFERLQAPLAIFVDLGLFGLKTLDLLFAGGEFAVDPLEQAVDVSHDVTFQKANNTFPFTSVGAAA